MGRQSDLRLQMSLPLRLASDAPPGTRVRRGVVELRAASLGVELPSDPGRHEIFVDAPRYAARRYVLDLQERERITIAVAPGTRSHAASRREPNPSSGIPRVQGHVSARHGREENPHLTWLILGLLQLGKVWLEPPPWARSCAE